MSLSVCFPKLYARNFNVIISMLHFSEILRSPLSVNFMFCNGTSRFSAEKQNRFPVFVCPGCVGVFAFVNGFERGRIWQAFDNRIRDYIAGCGVKNAVVGQGGLRVVS